MMNTQDDSGLLINITGDGKGKTTSAFGMVFRALGHDKKITVIQFIKSPNISGEAKMAQQFPGQIDYFCFGCGFIFDPDSPEARENRRLAQDAWALTQRYLQELPCDILVLDEFNIVLAMGLIDLDEVIDSLQKRRKNLDVIITGRSAPEAILEISDLVSEIKAIKHPYDKGILAKKGIDF